jgi:hypothetical protein
MGCAFEGRERGRGAHIRDRLSHRIWCFINRGFNRDEFRCILTVVLLKGRPGVVGECQLVESPGSVFEVVSLQNFLRW